MDIKKEVIKKFGKSVLDKSSLTSDYEALNELIKIGYKEGNIVEIGTRKGLSAALLAQYTTGKIYTFDPNPDPISQKIWKHLGISKKIVQMHVDFEKTANVKDLDFTFAYIDGDHSFEMVCKDFLAVKHCNNVMFHDYSERAIGIFSLINALGGIEIQFDNPLKMQYKLLAETWCEMHNIENGNVLSKRRVALWQKKD